MLRFLPIFLLFLMVYSDSVPMPTMKLATLNGTVILEMPQVANYQRSVYNTNTKKYEDHVYRVCNGKNKAKCGFWENTKTKKKVASGPTSYNKNKKALVIKKIRKTDEGTYTGGKNLKQMSYQVTFPIMLGSSGK